MNGTDIGQLARYADELVDMNLISAAAALLFIRLITRHRAPHQWSAVVSYDELAGDGICRKTAITYMHEICDVGLLVKERRWLKRNNQMHQIRNLYIFRPLEAARAYLFDCLHRRAEARALAKQQAAADERQAAEDAAAAARGEFLPEETVTIRPNSLPLYECKIYTLLKIDREESNPYLPYPLYPRARPYDLNLSVSAMDFDAGKDAQEGAGDPEAIDPPAEEEGGRTGAESRGQSPARSGGIMSALAWASGFDALGRFFPDGFTEAFGLAARLRAWQLPIRPKGIGVVAGDMPQNRPVQQPSARRLEPAAHNRRAARPPD